MATRFLEQGMDLPTQPYYDKAPFGVEDDGVLRISRGARFKGSQSADPGAEVVQVNRKPILLAATATAQTATAADVGTVFIANTTVTVTLTIPSAASVGPGADFGLVVGAVTTSGGHKITPAASDTIIPLTNQAAGSAAQCSAASDVLGDLLVVRSDGATSWYVVARTGTWAAAAA